MILVNSERRQAN